MDIDGIMAQAKRVMLKQGTHYPMVIIEDSKRSHLATLNFLPATTLEKQKLLFTVGYNLAMERDIEARDVKQLVWLCETWFTSVAPEELKNVSGSLENYPGRQEGLIVLALNTNEQHPTQEMCVVEIIRHGSIVDLVPRPKPMQEVKSGLLVSCMAGVCAASLEEDTLAEIIKKYASEEE